MLKFNLLDILAVKQLTKGKKILIYGTNRKAYELRKVLINAGVNNTLGYIKDSESVHKNICDGEVFTIDDILDKKKQIYVLLTDSKGCVGQAEKITEKGFSYHDDFIYLDNIHTQTKLNLGMALDPNMGHGTCSDNGSGCRFFGDYENAQIKIAVNGASLVDEMAFMWKIWPELMYERMKEKGLNVALAVHACYGYTTSQCFLKFIRDIVPQKPDILIDYSPWENDCFYGEKISTPYVVGYQKKEMKLLLGRIEERYESRIADKMQIGRTVKINTEDAIANNIIFTKLICDEVGIDYICVLPPSIVTKKKTCLKDEELYFSLGKTCGLVKKICDKALDKYKDTVGDDLLDARDWIDEYDGIFYDQFHMYTDGNMVISNKMLEKLNERFGWFK